VFPGYDFTSVFGLVQDLQSALANAVNAGIVLALKIGLLWLVYQLVAAFLPRLYRPVLALAILTLVAAYPSQASALGDAAVGALARAGLVPQVHVPDLTGLVGQAQIQVPQLPDIDSLLTQLGL